VLGGRRTKLDASYIHDTFTDIVEALLMACEGQDAVEWAYFHEPASTHAYLTHADGGRAISRGLEGSLGPMGEAAEKQLAV